MKWLVWEILSDRENMTIVGAKLCVCVCMCVWSGLGRLTWQRGLTLPAWLIMQAFFLPLFHPFLSFSDPFISFPVFSFFFCVCFTFLFSLSAFLAYSFFLLFPLPSLCRSLCALRGKGLSLYHRVEPLSCGHFIHMEAWGPFAIPLFQSHIEKGIQIKHTHVCCCVLHVQSAVTVWYPNPQITQPLVPVDGADAGNTVVVANSLSQEPVPDLPGKHGGILAFVIGDLVDHFGCSNLWFGSPDYPRADAACFVVPMRKGEVCLKQRQGHEIYSLQKLYI